MAEPTVQVPVSLIERIDSAYNASSDTLAALIEQLWMLSQSNAELAVLTPLRVAYMVPGSTFKRTTDMWKAHERGASTGRMMVESPEGTIRYLDDLDPSTIRDVTPPNHGEL